MRLLLSVALACCLTTPLLAQSGTTAPVVTPAASQPVDQLLAIPVPANVRVRLDFDTRGDDLLGIMIF